MSGRYPNTCDVCWGSHVCALAPRHEGDHACIDDDEGEPHHTVPRDGVEPDGFRWRFYGTLVEWSTGWCELCGRTVEWLWDHFREAHPDYVKDQGMEWPDEYLGGGRWADRSADTDQATEPSP